MITVLECLENAEYNLSKEYGQEIGLTQLRNAIKALHDGNGIDDDIDEEMSE